MAVEVTYTSRNYAPDKVRRRYVRLTRKGVYRWCEVGDDGRWDLRQGRCAASDLPEEVRVECGKFADHLFGFVTWPVT